MTSDAMSDFLTVAEVAEILKLNQQTVRNWIDAGKLPAYRVGRRVRIGRDDLNTLVNEGRTVASGIEPSVSGYTAAEFWDGVPLPSPET